MISIRSKGNFSNTEKLLKKSLGRKYLSVLHKYGKQGVDALMMTTPIDTGRTAASWYYEIIQNEGQFSIVWKNSNIKNGINIAVILQYGHATKNGGYVRGIDYINPALQPIFDQLADAAWKEVTSI
jgi:hypothetical protein